tara:strand:+ start:9303 stop:11042 length:1740 start_codon:yes stop_codon:yes gene_type:complete
MKNIRSSINFFSFTFILIIIFFLNRENIIQLLFGLAFLGLLSFVLFKEISIKNLTFYSVIYNLIPWDPLFSSNQSIYFPKILKNLNYLGLEDDWYSGFPAPYPIFNYFTEFLINTINLAAVELIPWIIISMGFMAIQKICLLLQIPSNKIFLISFTIAFLVIWSKLPPVGDNRIPEILSPIQELIGITQIFLGGLSSFSIFSYVYEPQAFDILFLFGIAYFMKKEYIISFLICVTLALFHYWLFLPIFVMYGIYITTENKSKNFTYYGILLLLPLIFVLIFNQITNKVDTNQANEINSENSLTLILDERLGIHRISYPKLTAGAWIYTESPIAFEFNYKNFQVNKINDNREILSGLSSTENGSSLPFEYLVLCFLGIKFSSNKNLRYFLLISNTIWISTFILNSLLEVPILKTFQPWRISSICIFLSTLLILSKLFDGLNTKLPNFLILTIILLSISFLTPSKGVIPQYPEFEKAKIDITQNLFVDPQLRDFSLNTGGRSVYVSRNFPYVDSGILEWNKRFKLNDQIFNAKDCRELKQLIVFSEFNSNYLVFDSSKSERNIKNIKNCDVNIIDLKELRS